MPNKIVISGYYGCGNIGDEAVLAGMLETFRRVGLEADITVLSAAPEDTAARNPGIRSIHRFALPAVLRALRQSDLVISGGGSLLQDVTSRRSLTFYLFILRAGRALRKKTMVYAQGIGPLIRPASRRAVGAVLNRTDLITVRDADSVTLLKTLGVRRPPVHLAADPAFVMVSDPAGADDLLRTLCQDDAPLIGVSLRPWPAAGEGLQEAVSGIRMASSEIGARVLVIPMQPERDRIVWPELIKGESIVPRPPGAAVIRGLVGRCVLVIGMRLHSLIFAASEAVPFAALSYDPKVSSFAATAGAPSIDIRDLKSGQLASTIVELWQGRDATRERLLDWREEMLRLATKSGELARQLLES